MEHGYAVDKSDPEIISSPLIIKEHRNTQRKKKMTLQPSPTGAAYFLLFLFISAPTIYLGIGSSNVAGNSKSS